MIYVTLKVDIMYYNKKKYVVLIAFIKYCNLRLK